MNRVVLLLFTFIFSTALFSYAQSPVPHDEPVNEYYNEVLQFHFLTLNITHFSCIY